MPRAGTFTDHDVLDAALRAVQQHGNAATIAQVSHELGGPVGSIYHRFGSRTVLLTHLWIRSIHRFQQELLALQDRPAPAVLDTIRRMAVHVPAYCREHQDEARALTLFSQRLLLTELDGPLRDEVAAINRSMDALARRVTEQHFGAVTDENSNLILWATRIGPYGLVRPYLGREIPALLEQAAAAQATAIVQLDTADTTSTTSFPRGLAD